MYWHCHGREDVSLVRDLSMGGLFIETPSVKAEGVRARLHFLVQEGQIRADAVVRHARAATGMGLKFTALSEQTKSLGEAYTRSATDAMNKTTKF